MFNKTPKVYNKLMSLKAQEAQHQTKCKIALGMNCTK